MLLMIDSGQGLISCLEYSTDLFKAATIRRMLGHWERLLEGIVAHPEGPVGELPLMSEAEERQVLVEWNDTRVDFGDIESRRSLRTAGSGLPPGAAGLHAGRQCSGGAADTRTFARVVLWDQREYAGFGSCRCNSAVERSGGEQPGAHRHGSDGGTLGVCDLYLRFHWSTEGRDECPLWGSQPAGLDATCLWTGAA